MIILWLHFPSVPLYWWIYFFQFSRNITLNIFEILLQCYVFRSVPLYWWIYVKSQVWCVAQTAKWRDFLPKNVGLPTGKISKFCQNVPFFGPFCTLSHPQKCILKNYALLCRKFGSFIRNFTFHKKPQRW